MIGQLKVWDPTPPAPGQVCNNAELATVASFGIAVLVTLASLLGLLASWPYREETGNWVLQARGQDLGNLLAAGVLVGSAIKMRAGSVRATQIWIGTLFYLLYAYIVYAFALHFGRLFLVYVTILGLVFYTLITALSTSARPSVYPRGASRLFAAWVLIVTCVLFALLWLSELIPATLSGQAPSSLETAGLIVNPIHVIDLSVVLPGMIIVGILALRGNTAGGLFLVIPALIFSVLMGSSIIAAMVLITISGDNIWVPMIMVSAVVCASLAAAIAYGHRVSGRSQPPHGSRHGFQDRDPNAPAKA